MSAGFVAATLGSLVGVAVLLAVLAWLRPAPVNVAAAIAELDDRARRDNSTLPINSRARWVRRLASSSARSSSRWWGIPAHDLDVLDLTAERFITRRMVWAGGAAAASGVFCLFCELLGLGLPLSVALAAVAVAAAAGSAVPVFAVQEDAARAREEFRHATAAYLDLVAQERATGRAPGQALDEAAAVGDSWAFARIRRSLNHAVHAGTTAWDALASLGQRMSVPELEDLASIVATAADGAAVYRTLLAKSAALRTAALSAGKADANARSQRLALPVALLLAAFLLLVLYPAAVRLILGSP
ncbi:type II secretion system F family protein [Amycolatopsis sp. La24]|uniref:type II secretion system F family protein n=1 Tax=Amycolatopsis sp. La24 TaxID=3028304 RepID=UPI0023AEFFF3|nr:type II secretion system F family protein [Amycolatopsis sp. La24]